MAETSIRLYQIGQHANGWQGGRKGSGGEKGQGEKRVRGRKGSELFTAENSGEVGGKPVLCTIPWNGKGHVTDFAEGGVTPKAGSSLYFVLYSGESGSGLYCVLWNVCAATARERAQAWHPDRLAPLYRDFFARILARSASP